METAFLLYIIGLSAYIVINDNPVTSENLPRCAVQMGSVAGIIGSKYTKVFHIFKI